MSSPSPSPRLLKWRTAVFPAGPQPPAPDGSVPRRTSTTSSRRQRSPPDLNRHTSSGRQCSALDLNHQLRTAVLPAGPQPQHISTTHSLKDRSTTHSLKDRFTTHNHKHNYKVLITSAQPQRRIHDTSTTHNHKDISTARNHNTQPQHTHNHKDISTAHSHNSQPQP